HDEAVVGGHSNTIDVWFDADGKGHVADSDSPGKTVYPVDIGVQFVCPTLYPNLYKQLELPELRNAVPLINHPALKLSGAFNDELVWGNFPDYQTAPRFTKCYDAETVKLAQQFEHDLHWSLFEHKDGKSVFGMTVGEYLQAAGYDQSSNFF